MFVNEMDFNIQQGEVQGLGVFLILQYKMYL